MCLCASLDISIIVPQCYAEIKPVEKPVRPIFIFSCFGIYLQILASLFFTCLFCPVTVFYCEQDNIIKVEHFYEILHLQSISIQPKKKGKCLFQYTFPKSIREIIIPGIRRKQFTDNIKEI